MNILLITPEFPPQHTGGGGVVFENLAKTYQKLGHDVLVISGDHTQKNIFQSLTIEREQGIDILRIPELYTPISLLNTVMPIPFWHDRVIKKIIKSYKPDFIHIHGYGLFMPAQLARTCRQLGLPYIFTIHGAPVSPEKMRNPIISLAYGLYHRYYGFPMLDGAKRITAVSGFARDFAVFGPWRERIEVIGNGINPEEYSDPGYDIFEQRGIRKTKNTKIILSLGRIEWIKGFEKIIEIMTDMLATGHDVVYCIAGRDNGYKKRLTTLAQGLNIGDRIFYLDFLVGNDKLSALYNCDIVAVPSITETYGLVALEARVVQKPVLTTFSGGLQDVLSEYNMAYSLENWKLAYDVPSKTEIIYDFSWKNIVSHYLQ